MEQSDSSLNVVVDQSAFPFRLLQRLLKFDEDKLMEEVLVIFLQLFFYTQHLQCFYVPNLIVMAACIAYCIQYYSSN